MWGVLTVECETGSSGLVSHPSSGRRSASLLPSIVAWEGTLTQTISLPCSSSKRSCSQRGTFATGPVRKEVAPKGEPSLPVQRGSRGGSRGRGVGGGGLSPPPPTVYGRSNTSWWGGGGRYCQLESVPGGVMPISCSVWDDLVQQIGQGTAAKETLPSAKDRRLLTYTRRVLHIRGKKKSPH